MALKSYFQKGIKELGIDEAGRGCLAGPVFAAAVILPDRLKAKGLNDSKKLSRKERNRLRSWIENKALAWSVASCSPAEIDRLNILWASVEAMHRAIAKLQQTPDLILVDGNKFKAYGAIPHQCIIGGDARYASIAAASILAKTWRDEYMEKLHAEYPAYGWDTNKGYPTEAHRQALADYGMTEYHRKSFHWQSVEQLEFWKPDHREKMVKSTGSRNH
jgi:ribonuclease HII